MLIRCIHRTRVHIDLSRCIRGIKYVLTLILLLQTVSYEADERGFKPQISYQDMENLGFEGYDINANSPKNIKGYKTGGNGYQNGGHGYQNGSHGYQNGGNGYQNGGHADTRSY